MSATVETTKSVLGPCVLWTGKRNTRDGYGCFHKNGIKKLAHRVAYENAYGPIPDGMLVLHHCDVKLCVEPTHLHLGSNADNHREARERGLWTPNYGELAPTSKLTNDQVLEIRRRRMDGESQRTLAIEFNVHIDTISKIHRRLAWAHI